MTLTLEIKPFVPDPSILRHPTLPKALSGCAPRVIKGKEWWDKERRAAYRESGYRCAACGADPNEANFLPRPIEAHECYDIDYLKHVAVHVRTVGLCGACHAFIHIGRSRHALSTRQLKRVLKRGMSLLRSVKVLPHWEHELLYEVVIRDKLAHKVRSRLLKEGRYRQEHFFSRFGEWTLVIGEERFTIFGGGQYVRENNGTDERGDG